MSGSLGFFTLLGGTDSQYLSVSGATSETLTSNYGLTLINDLTLYATKVCSATCIQNLNDTTVIIAPGANVGPVTFSQTCTIEDVNCTINALIDASLPLTLEQIQAALQNGTFDATTGFGYGITPETIKSVEDLNVTIKNSMYQMISSQCTFETNQTMNNNYVYVGSGSTTGAISFIQESNISTVDCAVDVIVKNTLYNEETSEQPKPSDSLMTFFIVLFVIILILSAIFVILYLVFIGDDAFSSNPDYTLNPYIYDEVDAEFAKPPSNNKAPFI